MFRDPSIAGEWPALVERLDRSGAPARWAAREPLLRSVRSVRDLADVGHGRADAVLGALVRLAASDGADDRDALLVALHLLSDGVQALARRLSDLHADATRLVVGELAVQIRACPWRRRTRAYAGNLLMDTRAALLRELRPGRTRAYPNRAEVLVDPQDERQVFLLLDAAVASPAESSTPELMDLLLWAARNGVASREDLRMLLEEAWARELGGAAQERVAARRGIDVRTVRRRRGRVLQDLQAAAGAYLAACA